MANFGSNYYIEAGDIVLRRRLGWREEDYKATDREREQQQRINTAFLTFLWFTVYSPI